MPNWKKVITSGSNAALNEVTASIVSASSFVGASTVQYQTGSSLLSSLTELVIKDFDSNVYVTASGGQLILQFGTPALPSFTDFSLPIGNSAGQWRQDRFTGPGTNTTYVKDQNYTFTVDYTLDPTNTFVSLSVVSNYFGTPTQIFISSSDQGGSATFGSQDMESAGLVSYFESGSHAFTASICVDLADGSRTSVLSNVLERFVGAPVDTYKVGAANPSINSTWTLDKVSFSSYVNNTSAGSFTTSVIEQGVTGQVQYYNSQGSTSNGWTATSRTPTSPGTVITINQTGTPSTATVNSSWSSNGQGTPSTDASSRSKSFSRIISLRSGASANSSSFSEAELLDIDTWINGSEVEDGNIQFNTTTITNGTTNVVITNTVGAFYYIIYNDSVNDLTAIRQGGPEGSNVLSSFTKSTVSTTGGLTYKVYKLNLPSSPVTNNTFYLFN